VGAPRICKIFNASNTRSRRWEFPFASCSTRQTNHGKCGGKSAFTRIKQLDDIFSDYDTDSELSRLSQTAGRGTTVRVSDDLWRVLEPFTASRERDGGRIRHHVRAGGESLAQSAPGKKLPDPVKLEEAKRAVGFDSCG